jgi:hypothetical protein
LEKCIELQRLPEIARNAQFGHPRPVPWRIGGGYRNNRRLRAAGVLAKLGEDLPSVNLREVEVQKQEIGLRSSARFSDVRYPSQRFRTIVDNIQLVQDVILPESFLHKQHVPGVVFRQ